MGGTSPERPISIRSANAVCAALKEAGHDVGQFDMAEPIDTLTKILSDYDVVFPVLHGKGGEDGSIQSVLESNNVTYIGPDSKSSALCYDKWLYKQHLFKFNLPHPEGAIVAKNDFSSHVLTNHPFVLKPYDGGSSIDTHIVREVTNSAKARCLESFDRHDSMLLEALIPGTELTVGVLGDEALPVIEIIPPEGKEFDLDNKYNGASQELCPPKNATIEQQSAAQELALQAHKITGCRHMSRTDIMLSPEGSLYVLETNTIPGMTAQSLFPISTEAVGLTMPLLMDRLIELATRN